MVRVAISFFVIGILAVLLGANNVAGLSLEIGKTLLYMFVVLAVLSFLASMVTGNHKRLP